MRISEIGSKPQTIHENNLRPPAPSRYLWLLLAPFLIAALLAASHAPGFLWSEEGYGYDILEYHLQLPKEYAQAGRIAYAPHNVYGNFPANVEMLYLLAMVIHQDIYDVGTIANFIHLVLGAGAVFGAWVMGREWSAAAGMVSALALGMVGWLGYLSGLAYVENGLLFFGIASLATVLRGMSLPWGPPRRHWIVLGGVLAGFACGCKYTAVAMVALPIALGSLIVAAGLRQRLVSAAWFFAGCAITFAPWLLKNAVMTGNPTFPLGNTVFHSFPPGWGPSEQQRWDRGHSVADSERTFPARLHALWRHVAADRYQRFGPAILVIALAGLLARQRDRCDAFLIAVLAIQLVVWLGWTHLYARFAVPILIPLSVLAGRSLAADVHRKRRGVLVAGLAAGAAWNLLFELRLLRTEMVDPAPAAFFYEGHAPGFEYLGVVNRELPVRSRLLMLGDARAFYIQRPVGYAVIFNSSPFVQEVERANRTNEVVDWLRKSGYTHVLVHWSEVERLRRTYGFSDRITPQLFDELSAAGLSMLQRFPHPATGGRYVDLYVVGSPSQTLPDGP